MRLPGEVFLKSFASCLVLPVTLLPKLVRALDIECEDISDFIGCVFTGVWVSVPTQGLWWP